MFKSARQVGKTESTAVKALHAALLKPGCTILLIAPTLRQSSILFWRIKNLIARLADLRSLVTRETQTTVHFLNGSEIIALPAGPTGETIRGYSADLIIMDEAAYIPDKVFEAVEPALAAKNGQLILISTPFGANGYFYRAYNSALFSTHTVSAVECPWINPTFLQAQREMLSEDGYRQEYLAEFIALSNQFFSEEEVRAWLADKPKPEALHECEAYLGVDLARFGADQSVFTMAAINTVTLDCFILAATATNKQPLTDAMGRVRALHEQFNFRRIFIDETGLGGGVADVIKEAQLPVTPITFTLENQEDLYKNLKWLSENQKIKVCFAPHPWFFRQFVELKPSYTSTGRLKLESPEGGHADFPDSLALAVWAARHKFSGFSIAGVRR